LDYCSEFQLPYFIDSSNNEKKYFRNQTRLEILPYLEKFNPQLTAGLVRLADIVSEENRFLENETYRIYEEIVACSGEERIISRNSLVSLPVALQRRLIKLILSYLSPKGHSIDYFKIEAVRRAADDSASSNSTIEIG